MPSSSLRLPASAAAALLLGGCGGAGGGSSPTGAGGPPATTGPSIAITALHVAGSTSEACTVSVDGSSDGDPSPGHFNVRVGFSDPGMANPIAATVDLRATDTAGNRITNTIVVTANPATSTGP